MINASCQLNLNTTMNSLEVAKKARGRRGGRKPATDAPKDKRTAQLRRAQRAFLEKKKKRLEELERKEIEFEKLRMENAILRRHKEILIDLLMNGSKYKHCTSDGLLNSLMLESSESNSATSIVNNCIDYAHGKIVLQTSDDHELYEKVFKKIYYVCNGLDCKFPIVESNIPVNSIPDTDVTFPLLSDDMDEFWSDFGSKLENINLFGRLYIPINSYEQESNRSTAQICSGHGNRTLSCSSSKPTDACLSDVASYKVLLSLYEIWYHITALRQKIYFDLEKLGSALREEAICFDANVHVPLDVFLRIVASFSPNISQPPRTVEKANAKYACMKVDHS